MPKDPKENKKEEQQVEQTTPPATAAEAPAPAPSVDTTETDDEVLIPEQTIEDINNEYITTSDAIKQGYKEQSDAVTKAYGAQMGGYDAFLEQVGKEQEALNAQDEEARKKANAYRYITGIGDAISGVANLVGVAHGAANQQQYYNAPALVQKAEAARKERKIELDKLSARMDELRAQRTALESARDLKLGELAGSQASDLAAAELKRLQGVQELHKANTKAKTTLTKAAMDNAAKVTVAETREQSDKGKQHPIDLGGGKSVVIPDNLWTDTAIEEAYNLISEDRRTRRHKVTSQGTVAKRPVIDANGQPVKDANGKTVYEDIYERASLQDKKADIVREAKNNPELQKYLERLANNPIYANL